MKRPELYQKTIDMLVQAYLDDTLEHGNQCGCAVGNIVAGSMGIRLIKRTQYFETSVVPDYFTDTTEINTLKNRANNGLWFDAISGGIVCLEYMNDEINFQVSSTGYSANQLSLIERAFEHCNFGNSDDDYMFNGLMSVIDCLDQIHENTDTITTQETKNKFTRKLQTT